ncbi:hypothetical protein LINGRAHAP2_LOCUS22428 [Linum grandiflorum]
MYDVSARGLARLDELEARLWPLRAAADRGGNRIRGGVFRGEELRGGYVGQVWEDRVFRLRREGIERIRQEDRSACEFELSGADSGIHLFRPNLIVDDGDPLADDGEIHLPPPQSSCSSGISVVIIVAKVGQSASVILPRLSGLKDLPTKIRSHRSDSDVNALPLDQWINSNVSFNNDNFTIVAVVPRY